MLCQRRRTDYATHFTRHTPCDLSCRVSTCLVCLGGCGVRCAARAHLVRTDSDPHTPQDTTKLKDPVSWRGVERRNAQRRDTDRFINIIHHTRTYKQSAQSTPLTHVTPRHATAHGPDTPAPKHDYVVIDHRRLGATSTSAPSLRDKPTPPRTRRSPLPRVGAAAPRHRALPGAGAARALPQPVCCPHGTTHDTHLQPYSHEDQSPWPHFAGGASSSPRDLARALYASHASSRHHVRHATIAPSLAGAAPGDLPGS